MTEPGRPRHASSLREIQDNGYCVVENVIPAEELKAIEESVRETVRLQRRRYSSPKHVGFTPGLINHDQSYATYLASPQLMPLLGDLLGAHIRISFTSAIINEPGNERGSWHADWPFNQHNAGRVPTPYADVLMHVTTLWMLSPFSRSNGGTLVLPGSHRRPQNPTVAGSLDADKRLPDELQVIGPAGSVVVMDSRLWHATAVNDTKQPRVALAVRYAPWWLNLEVLRPNSEERKRMCDEAGATDNIVPSVPQSVYDRLPQDVQPLYRHWIAKE